MLRESSPSSPSSDVGDHRDAMSGVEAADAGGENAATAANAPNMGDWPAGEGDTNAGDPPTVLHAGDWPPLIIELLPGDDCEEGPTNAVHAPIPSYYLNWPLESRLEDSDAGGEGAATVADAPAPFGTAGVAAVVAGVEAADAGEESSASGSQVPATILAADAASQEDAGTRKRKQHPSPPLCDSEDIEDTTETKRARRRPRDVTGSSKAMRVRRSIK
ncbi:hypothetical protein EV121DRAFT_297349 [Schizophyllum commune]